MLRFRGRSHHIYRMPSKPITQGYKVFSLCDKCYTYSWTFASRSDSFECLVLQKDLRLTPTSSTVFQLACTLPHTTGLHYKIYMDNYFPSQSLFIKPRSLGIGAYGTARGNKSAFPPDLVDERKSIPWNEMTGGSADPDCRILAVQWQDNSAMHFLSTIHMLGPGDRVTSQRKKPRKSSTNGPPIQRVFGPNEEANVPIPAITHHYNQYKVGVHVADQYRSYYFTQQVCLRNWPSILYWSLDATIINSYLILSQLPSLPTNYRSGSSRIFRETLAETLAESIIKTYGQKNLRPSKSYYTRKTTSPRYS